MLDDSWALTHPQEGDQQQLSEDDETQYRRRLAAELTSFPEAFYALESLLFAHTHQTNASSSSAEERAAITSSDTIADNSASQVADAEIVMSMRRSDLKLSDDVMKYLFVSHN